MLWFLAAALATVVLMEPYSAWIHRAVWHGPLWFIHRTHHRERMEDGSRPAPLVANDILSASHAPVAIACCAVGWLATGPAAWVAMGVGIGMTVYGVLYVVLHDGMVHGRLPVTGLLRHRIFDEMRQAHAIHHRTNAAPYGFFVSPWWGRARAGSQAGSQTRSQTR